MNTYIFTVDDTINEAEFAAFMKAHDIVVLDAAKRLVQARDRAVVKMKRYPGVISVIAQAEEVAPVKTETAQPIVTKEEIVAEINAVRAELRPILRQRLLQWLKTIVARLRKKG